MPSGGMKRRHWIFELYRDKKAEFRWRLLASNGRIIADSGEGYKRRQDCTRMIRALREKLFESQIVDLTKKKAASSPPKKGDT